MATIDDTLRDKGDIVRETIEENKRLKKWLLQIADKKWQEYYEQVIKRNERFVKTMIELRAMELKRKVGEGQRGLIVDMKTLEILNH